MKVLILAGGFGSRLSEETDSKPKPIVEIGGMPIIWHIMKTYSHYGFYEFVILLGYKGYLIKEYFANYLLHQSDVTLNLSTGEMEVHQNLSEPWKVTFLNTGLTSMTGSRIKKAQAYIENKPFLLTYGDGLADLNISELVKFHSSTGGLITMTSAQPDGRFGALELNQDKVTSFREKPKGDGSWINAGYFVCEPSIFDYISDGDNVVFEQEPLQNLAVAGELYTHRHDGFWMPMDTLRDKRRLNQLVEDGQAPWMIW